MQRSLKEIWITGISELKSKGTYLKFFNAYSKEKSICEILLNYIILNIMFCFNKLSGPDPNMLGAIEVRSNVGGFLELELTLANIFLQVVKKV